MLELLRFMKNRLGLARPGALLALALVAAGCGLDGPQSTLDPDGPVAGLQYDVFQVTLWVSLGIFMVVGSLMLYAIFRFRSTEAKEAAGLPPQSHGNVALEVTLTLISILLVGIIAFPTVQGIFAMSTVPPSAQPPLEVQVTGHQWWWNFEYPVQPGFEKPLVISNELAIPTGRPVKLHLETKDVIHSFWVPRLAGKLDLIPNQKNWMWLEADQTGRYFGQCAEFCGESHAFMKFRVFALEPKEFEAWVRHQSSDAEAKVAAEDAAAAKGQQLFQTRKCATCHTVRGTRASFGKAGPDLTHFASRDMLAAAWLDNTDANVREWLAHSWRIKPGNSMFRGGIALKDEETMAHWRQENARIVEWNKANLPADVASAGVKENPGLGNLALLAAIPEPNLTEEDLDALVAYLRTLR